MESSTEKIRQLSPDIQWSSLDEPIKLLIISFAAEHLFDFSGKSIDKAIYDIKTAALFHRKTFHSVIDNLLDDRRSPPKRSLLDFTCVIHKLMVVYVDLSTEDIANKFNTPVSSQYVTLSRSLLLRVGNRGGINDRNMMDDMLRQARPDNNVCVKMDEIRSDDQLQDIKDMIDEGADINFTMRASGTNYKITPLFFAMQMQNMGLAKLLMEHPKISMEALITVTKTLETIKENRKRAGLR